VGRHHRQPFAQRQDADPGFEVGHAAVSRTGSLRKDDERLALVEFLAAVAEGPAVKPGAVHGYGVGQKEGDNAPDGVLEEVVAGGHASHPVH